MLNKKLKQMKFITNCREDVEWTCNIFTDKKSKIRITSKQEGNKITINFFIKNKSKNKK